MFVEIRECQSRLKVILHKKEIVRIGLKQFETEQSLCRKYLKMWMDLIDEENEVIKKLNLLYSEEA